MIGMLGCSGSVGSRQAIAHEASTSHGVELPVVLHFATRQGREAVDPARVGAWMANTRILLQPHGIDVVLADVRTLPPDASANGVLARFRLLSRVDTSAVHVMIVDDLDGLRRDGDATVRGLHFSAPFRRAEYVALSPDATPSTLAHEIGHYLGLEHEPDASNVMCSCDRTPNPTLSAAQGIRMRRTLVE
jgi:hypothetical protein